jgi:DNA-directed RNA polymerase subunit RPC12/RpoP
MTTFECPRCHQRTEALASQAGHRCPQAKSKFIVFVKKEKVTV